MTNHLTLNLQLLNLLEHHQQRALVTVDRFIIQFYSNHGVRADGFCVGHKWRERNLFRACEFFFVELERPPTTSDMLQTGP